MACVNDCKLQMNWKIKQMRMKNIVFRIPLHKGEE